MNEKLDQVKLLSQLSSAEYDSLDWQKLVIDSEVGVIPDRLKESFFDLYYEFAKASDWYMFSKDLKFIAICSAIRKMTWCIATEKQANDYAMLIKGKLPPYKAELLKNLSKLVKRHPELFINNKQLIKILEENIFEYSAKIDDKVNSEHVSILIHSIIILMILDVESDAIKCLESCPTWVQDLTTRRYMKLQTYNKDENQ